MSPDSLLSEFGVRRGQVAAAHYRSADPAAHLIELGRMSIPADRKLSEHSLRDLLPKMLGGTPSIRLTYETHRRR